MKKITLWLFFIVCAFFLNNASFAHNRSHLQKNALTRSTLQMQDNEYAEYIETIPFSFSLGTITLADALKELAQEIYDGYTLPELSLCMQALEDGKEGIDAVTLEPLMPYIIKRIAPELLENNTPENITLDTMITRAQRRESQPCSINKDWNTPVTPASCDLSAVLRLLCLIQKQIEICCREIKIEIRECCEEIIETITECCEELSEEIAECCEELSLEIEEVQETLEECCEEIQEDIAECCEEVIETITECCQEIIERLVEINNGCGSTIASLPAIISEPGNYTLTQTLTLTTSDAIIITASNVTLDLCGNTIIGNGTFDGIVIDGGELGITNVTIKNGSIDAMNNALVAENVRNITCTNVRVSSSANGFNLINCQDALLAQCIATFCTEHGFLLQGQIPPVVRVGAKCTGCDIEGVTNRYNTVKECRAISTRSVTSNVYGFRSIAGLNNTFIHCLAQDTRTDDTTNASIAAGFALGPVNFGTLLEPNICSECGSKIIECEVCDTTAAEVEEFIVGSRPIGIQLASEYDLNDFVLLDQQDIGPDVPVAWSPDGCFLASGSSGVNVSNQLRNWSSGIIYPRQCTIKKNQTSRVFGGCGGFGIQAGSSVILNDADPREAIGGCGNLIINNLVYEADFGFAGVTQVYRTGLSGFPGFFDNIQVPPYCFPCGLCCPVLP